MHVIYATFKSPICLSSPRYFEKQNVFLSFLEKREVHLGIKFSDKVCSTNKSKIYKNCYAWVHKHVLLLYFILDHDVIKLGKLHYLKSLVLN